jgi:cold shock CspA family protein
MRDTIMIQHYKYKKNIKKIPPIHYSIMSQSGKTLGMVKWFDKKGGFGFITILKGEESEGKDIFVHFSSLTTMDSQYKYLVLGEYVEFVLEKATSEKYEFLAKEVSGIRGGNLMCESRRLSFESSKEKVPTTDKPKTPTDKPKRFTPKPKV